MDELEPLDDWLSGLLSQLEPGARRAAAMDVARELRRSHQKRIVAQRNPDGSAYEPRKPRQLQDKQLREKAGRIKRRAMFAKLRTARMLKVEASAEGLALGFTGRVARLARVHQEGLESDVAPGGARYKYPVRQLLGFDQAERDMIQEQLLERLAR